MAKIFVYRTSDSGLAAIIFTPPADPLIPQDSYGDEYPTGECGEAALALFYRHWFPNHRYTTDEGRFPPEEPVDPDPDMA